LENSRLLGRIIMAQVVEVTCPKCKKIFVVNPHMLGSGMKFHCPFCDAYFDEKDSPKIKK
jgi:uncharacterized Zn-finger protein